MAVVIAATAGSPAKAVRLRASQGREDVATEVPTPDCNSWPLERSRSEIKLNGVENLKPILSKAQGCVNVASC